ncbi:MAG: ABC transporter ATP-binding protein [Oscillospiraceae bacterium]|nr:ABC transporter ATP-binding protein [Oscillospiraceae bacterium]
MENDVMVRVQNVTMKFNGATEKIDSIKEYIIKLFKRSLHFQLFNALTNVSFEVRKGEVLGLVGLNGSGKSTMLKIISGIMKPTEGTAEIYGSLSPLIELGAGFDPDLTGRENIFLNGSLLGYSKEFMESIYDEIVSFAELENFIDVQIKNYSSGMQARLGFAIATVVKPQILICDEVLAVGDYKFQKKCEERIQELMSGETTVILVSHSIEQIRKLCDRVVWLEKGNVRMIGPCEEVCDAYEKE